MYQKQITSDYNSYQRVDLDIFFYHELCHELLGVVFMVINSMITKYNLTNLNNIHENIQCLVTKTSAAIIFVYCITNQIT